MSVNRGLVAIGYDSTNRATDSDWEWLEKEYLVLVVEPDASRHGISRTYRPLARSRHADAQRANGPAEDRLEISAAHHVLRDETRRAEHDKIRRLAADRNPRLLPVRSLTAWLRSHGTRDRALGGPVSACHRRGTHSHPA
jgi:curved DNA-binding protein CbpA